LVFLTADHAGAENVTYLKDNKYNVNNLNSKNIQQSIKEYLEKEFGDNYLLDYSNYNIFLDKVKLKTKGIDIEKVKTSVKNFLLAQDYVKNVYTEEQIQIASVSDNYLQAIQRGYDPKQNGELIILLKPAYVEYSTTGTTHGSPYSYDTHVPVLFFGWGISKGESHAKKYITQIAPTLAQKLKITMPNGTQSEVLEEILN
jgi:hypothetical protein